MEKTTQFNRLLRLRDILAPKGPIPVCKSSWWNRVRSGEYPQPLKLGPHTTVWREQDIVALIRRIEAEAGYDV